MAEGEPHFLVERKADGRGPSAVISLRRWLKTALRQHGLRAVRVEEVRPDEAAPRSGQDVFVDSQGRGPP